MSAEKIVNTVVGGLVAIKLIDVAGDMLNKKKRSKTKNNKGLWR